MKKPWHYYAWKLIRIPLFPLLTISYLADTDSIAAAAKAAWQGDYPTA